MWIAGIDRRDIQRHCRITAKQWEWMFREGDASRGLPSFESMWLEQVEAIRSKAIETGKEISTRAPDVIRQKMENAHAAGSILGRMLKDIERKLEAGKTPDSVLPSDRVIRAMRVLDSISDGKAAAESFRAIFVDHASSKSLAIAGTDNPARPIPEENEGGPAPTEITDGFWSEWSRMTPEQKQRLAEEGEEPDPKDLLDVEVTVSN